MATYKPDNANDRQTAAAQARRALIEKFRNQPKADDPEVVARAMERKAVAEARDQRAADRQAERDAAAQRQREADAAEAARVLAAEAEQRRLEAVQAAEAAEAARLAQIESMAQEERVALLDEDKRRRAGPSRPHREVPQPAQARRSGDGRPRDGAQGGGRGPRPAGRRPPGRARCRGPAPAGGRRGR
ncbi:MAG TPA: DUF6481 family protein, partial [Roseococcus sp.]|nr:DUF6481 family protein [Roseococcus sp.]